MSQTVGSLREIPLLADPSATTPDVSWALLTALVKRVRGTSARVTTG